MRLSQRDLAIALRARELGALKWARAELSFFTESLDERFAVRIEEFLAALLLRRLEFGRGDVPVRPAFLGNGT